MAVTLARLSRRAALILNEFMQKSELIQGRSYAWCESSRMTRPPVIRVCFLGLARAGKAKVRWEDGELSGLEEWVATRQIVCPWDGRQVWLRDRQRQADLDKEADEIRDRVVENAISHTLTATGEEGGFIRTWTLGIEKAQRLWQRAALASDPRDEPLAYVDRHGQLHLGYASALKFAKAFAGAEPEPCLQLIEHWESELRAEGYLPGHALDHDFLRAERPAYALVRQWAGQAEVELLKTEITRLQGLVSTASRELRAAGQDHLATSLERALRGR